VCILKNYLSYDELVSKGMNKRDINQQVLEGKLQYVGKKIYVNPEFMHSGLQTDATYLAPESVFCLISALDIHGMTLRIPHHFWLATNLNRKTFQANNNTYKFYKTTGMWYRLGIETQLRDGEPIFVYDIEKTICDVIKNKDLLIHEDVQYCIEEYTHEVKNYEKLLDYARILGIEKELKSHFTGVF
jgi:predicted transcriptional regulator of viral defense system